MIRIFTVALPILLLAGCFSQQPAPSVDRSTAIAGKAAVQPAGPGFYTVKRGDTLFRIALENGQDYRDLASWNNLVNPDSIKEGQVLRVAPPAVAATDSAQGTIAKPVTIGPVVEARPLEQPAAPSSEVSSSNSLKREPKVGKEPYSDEAYARLNKSTIDATVKPAVVSPESKPEVSVPLGPDDIVWNWPVSGKVSAPFSESSNKGLDFAGKVGDPIYAAGDGKVVYAGSGLRGYGELVIVKHNATFLSAYAHNRKILVKEGQQVSRGQKIAEMGNSDADGVKLHFEIRKQGKPIDPAIYLPKR